MSAILGLTFFKSQGDSWIDRARAQTRRKILAAKKDTVLTEVADEETAAATKYYLQGDASLSTEEAFKERQKLRRHPTVLAKLDKWWLAVKESAKRDGHLPDRMCKKQYFMVYRLLYWGLLGDEDYDEADAKQEAEEEWARDSADGINMGRTQLLDAIFEVTDVYTDSLDPEGALILHVLESDAPPPL